MDTEINNKIVDIAKELIERKDITSLLNFREAEFEEIRIGVGWDKEMAWSSYMIELVWREAFKIKEILPLFNCGSLATWYNFRKSDWLVGESPRVGAIHIWQGYKEGVPGIRSGSGIVSAIEDNFVRVIEGVVSKKGDNENLIVIEKLRNLNYSLMTGERPKGFIYTNKAIV